MRVLDETRIHPGTRMGPVHYTVADLERQIAFYRDVLGFRLLWRRDGEAALGAPGRELLRLVQRAGARRMRAATGLYHTAFLVPARRDLAHLVRELIVRRTPVQGTSDHGTHLAIYLADPEGNGIELAWDYPREAWPMRGGRLDFGAMRRGGVDVDDLLTELEGDVSPWEGLTPGTVVGHVHLHVADLDESQRFYHGVLGFDVTLRSDGFGALFVSAGGYHHHIGMNIWRGKGLPPAPEDALGLRYYTVLLPDDGELRRLAGRLSGAGVAVAERDGGLWFRDPAGIGVMLAVG